MHPIAAIHDWIVGHYVTTTIAVLIISIYGEPIRSFLGIWPIRTLRAGTRNAHKHRLETIEYLHKDTYRLVLFLAMSVIGAVIACVVWWVIIDIFYIAIFRSSALPMSAIFIAVGVGSLFRLNGVLSDLLNFETSSVRLKEAIAEHERKLALR